MTGSLLSRSVHRARERAALRIAPWLHRPAITLPTSVVKDNDLSISVVRDDDRMVLTSIDGVWIWFREDGEWVEREAPHYWPANRHDWNILHNVAGEPIKLICRDCLALATVEVYA